MPASFPQMQSHCAQYRFSRSIILFQFLKNPRWSSFKSCVIWYVFKTSLKTTGVLRNAPHTTLISLIESQSKALLSMKVLQQNIQKLQQKSQLYAVKKIFTQRRVSEETKLSFQALCCPLQGIWPRCRLH